MLEASAEAYLNAINRQLIQASIRTQQEDQESIDRNVEKV